MKLIASIIIYCFIACQNSTSVSTDLATDQKTIVKETLREASVTPLPEEDVLQSSKNLDAGIEQPIDEQVNSAELTKETKVRHEKSNSKETDATIPESALSERTSKRTLESAEVVIPVESESSKAEDTKEAKAESEAVSTTSSVPNSNKSSEVVKEKTQPTEEKKVAQTETMALDHSAFNGLLQKHISSAGVVDYTSFKKDEAKIDKYLQHLSDHTPASDWSKNKGLAYWINAYNAGTIKLILKNYPVNKITDLEGGKPWDVSWIKLGDKTYSLNDIEHNTIRPTYNDARIHFAVNCAAKSCPPIWNQAFTEDNVDGALTRLTKQFVNSSANKISKNELTLSKIFEWYAEDFGDIQDFINIYSDVKVDDDASVSHSEYDWSLNGK